MSDYAWHADLLAGKKPPIYEGEPQCGYFKLRDRRGLNKNLAPIKRPWVACAIWRGKAGELKAELAGVECDVDRIWPYCAKYPVSYDDYRHWHQHERFPEKAA